MQTLTASCLCGATKHSAQVPIDSLPQPAWMCHCDSCRHQNGTLGYTATRWPEATINQDQGTMTAYEFSPTSEVLFCSTCGAHMFWCSKGDPGEVGVTTRTLSESNKVVNYMKHMFLEDTKDSGSSIWLPAVGDQSMKLCARDEDGEELPPGWRDERAVQERNETDLLHAYCLCKGVEFHVSRPDLPSNGEEPPWYMTEDRRYRGALCVCNSCTLSAGVEIVQWAYVPTSNIKLANGDDYKIPFGTLKAYKSSDTVTRYFCGCCGAIVFFTTMSRPEIINIAPGLFDAPSGARAEEWLDWTMDEDLDFTEDAPNQALADSLKATWREWKQEELEKRKAGLAK